MSGGTGLLLATVLLAAAGGGWLEQSKDLPLPPLPEDAPTLVEAENMFGEMVEALEAGDRRALVNMTLSTRRHFIPDPLPPVGPEIVRQLVACRILRPLFVIKDQQILYFQYCEAAGERMETLFILQRDHDGKWRIKL